MFRIRLPLKQLEFISICGSVSDFHETTGTRLSNILLNPIADNNR